MVSIPNIRTLKPKICYMIRMGCDGIITNYPDRGLKARLEESK